MKKQKKRNPSDSTMRNVRAANRRIDELERRMVRAIHILSTTLASVMNKTDVEELRRCLYPGAGK